MEIARSWDIIVSLRVLVSWVKVGSLESYLGPSIVSGEDIPVGEIFYVIDLTSDGRFSDKLTNKPLIILLENTFPSNAEFLAKCIQTRFCGVGLIPTVEDCHRSVINLCNLVAVETYNRDARFLVKVYRSVSRLPVQVVLNSGTHLLFDLTHLVSFVVDFYKIQEMGGQVKG